MTVIELQHQKERLEVVLDRPEDLNNIGLEIQRQDLIDKGHDDSDVGEDEYEIVDGDISSDGIESDEEFNHTFSSHQLKLENFLVT